MAGFKKVDHQAAKFNSPPHFIIIKSFVLIGAPRITIDRANFPPGIHTLTVTVTAEDGQRTISTTTELPFEGYNDIIIIVIIVIISLVLCSI